MVLTRGGRGRLGRMVDRSPSLAPAKVPTTPKPRLTGESGLRYAPEGKIRLPADHELQPVPGRIRRSLPHQGSASELR